MFYIAQRSVYCLYCTESLPMSKSRSMSGLIITTTIHIAPPPTWPVSVFDERDTPNGSSSVSMRQGR